MGCEMVDLTKKRGRRQVKKLKWLCSLFGHKYYVYAKPAETWGNGIRWLKCDRCGRSFAMNSRVRVLIPMDAEIEDMHEWIKQ